MLDHFRTLARGVTTAAIVIAVRGIDAQSTAASSQQADSRWTAWLGCWVVDGSREADKTSSSTGTTCFVPVPGARAIDALTISRGVIVSRDRLESSGRPHPIDGNGCRGTETANWSADGHRLYVRAEYTCAGAPGNSTALFAITSDGEWLRIEKIRAGGGMTVTATHLRPAALSSALSTSSAREIEAQQRAIGLARAAAATSISADDIVDAVNNLDGDVVRTWLVASDQVFAFDAQQITILTNAGVPSPILQIVSGVQIDGAVRAVVYPAGPAVVEQLPPVMTAMRACPPDGCYPVNPYGAANPYGAVNPYSAYNGPGFMPNGLAPPYGPAYSFPYPYPYSPLGSVPFTTFNVASPFINNRRCCDGKDRDRDRDHRRFQHGWQTKGNWPVGGRGPVGRGPSGRGR